jgi:hypothetical protein
MTTRCLVLSATAIVICVSKFNPLFNTLNTELNPICHLLAVFRAHRILHVSRIRVKMDVT